MIPLKVFQLIRIFYFKAANPFMHDGDCYIGCYDNARTQETSLLIKEANY